MALTQKKISNFSGTYGSPSSDTAWDKIEWGFDARGVKVIVEAGSTSGLDISLDGKELFGTLPAPEANQNALVYDFVDINISRMWVRKTGASVQILAYGVY